jgi:hypothetical protein
VTPAELLAAAREMLSRADPETAGLWPRATALLARQSLEASLDDFWRRKAVALDGCSMLAQLICLRSYVEQDMAGLVRHTWGALSAGCHHHPYELAPSVGELQALLASVSEFHAVVASTPGSQE